MAETLKLSDLKLQKPYKVYKADGGGITFLKLTYSAQYSNWHIALIAKGCPHEVLYMLDVSYNYNDSKITLTKKKERRNLLEDTVPSELSPEITSQKYWLSWYNDTIQMGLIVSSNYLKPFLTYEETDTGKTNNELIGFVNFTSNQYLDFVVNASPVSLKPICHKHVEGQLRWVKVTDGNLPHDAMIGGYENEPTYIARAVHGRSLCPGKYVHSKKKAYVAWGHMEHAKNVFEILCGFNGQWVKCKNDLIPENVFQAGKSEVNNEDIYIGRAMIGDDLVVGKVHMLYKTCYLPYKGKEVEKGIYEILVRGDKTTYGLTKQKNCLLNPLRALQPCMSY
ncbi:uncharacterized protein LOC112053741 [Bicyclus anynana]|uniref:Uncharacterized protein LOC112053741 n=1 Tax=Bicyclus anynana TaxID=110368 RepID=A0A6J1NMT6_BICAN|nr:uncharacterized protein LOC112053741 [Bicyclus anynana]